MQTALVILFFMLSIGYIAYKVRSQFVAKQGCNKGCGGACSNITLPHNTK